MMLHVSLEVEVGQLVILVHLKQLGKLGIGMDDATILLVLKLVGLDVGVDLLTHLSASHLGTNGLTKEGSQFLANKSRLYETRGLSVDVVAALLAGGLGSGLHLARDSLLQGLEIALYGREEADKLVELGGELAHLEHKR